MHGLISSTRARGWFLIGQYQGVVLPLVTGLWHVNVLQQNQKKWKYQILGELDCDQSHQR